MSKKRPADESISNEQMNDDSDPGFQQGNNAKRANLAPLNETTLQDLPFEMLESILLKAVTTEVKSMKLPKDMRKEKADLVINRLQTVCSKWSNILTTNFFRNEVNRILAQDTIRLEVLHELSVSFCVWKVVTKKDELVLLCRANGGWDDEDSVINVCEHNSAAIKVKHVIPLPGMPYVEDMAVCNKSNCLYVIEVYVDSISVFRITRDGQHQFHVSEWISDLDISWPIFAVSQTGDLVFVSRSSDRRNLPELSLYDQNGCFQHKFMLSEDICRSGWITNMFHKQNGNLVLVTHGDRCETQLTEVDMRGSIVRQYTSVLRSEVPYDANIADNHGRIWISDWRTTVELVDSEFNLIDFADPKIRPPEFLFYTKVHFNSERNEVVRISFREDNKLLTILRFI